MSWMVCNSWGNRGGPLIQPVLNQKRGWQNVPKVLHSEVTCSTSWLSIARLCTTCWTQQHLYSQVSCNSHSEGTQIRPVVGFIERVKQFNSILQYKINSSSLSRIAAQGCHSSMQRKLGAWFSAAICVSSGFIYSPHRNLEIYPFRWFCMYPLP